MRVSAIEIGTNSTKFIVMEVNNLKEFKILEKTSTVNRLSRKMYGNNHLSKESMLATANLISDYMKLIKRWEAELISVFSTSVLRDAINYKEFIDAIKDTHDINIDIISGEHEAYLAHFACTHLMKDNNKDAVVVDIGGGSTEVIFGDKNAINQKKSFDIGAVRLTEMFVKNDPMIHEEYEDICQYVKSALSEYEFVYKNELDLIGIGGSVKTVGRIFKGVHYDNEDEINGLTLEKKDVESILSMLRKMYLEERINIQGLNPKRADVIICGVIILLCIMEFYCTDYLTISSNGVLEGLLFEYCAKTKM